MIAVAARMCKAEPVRCRWLCRRTGIDADADPRKLQGRDYVVLAHHMVESGDAAGALHHEVERGINGIFVQFFCDLPEALALKLFVILVLSVNENDVIPT